MSDKIYICPKCGAQYLTCEIHQGECECESAFKEIYGDITPEEKSWIVSAFLETEKPVTTIQDPLDVYAYPPNRGRRDGNTIRFWGRVYDFRNRTVSGIVPVDSRILAFSRMVSSRDARSQFSEKEMREICKTR